MMSPNGSVPPIYVPPGYAPQVCVCGFFFIYLYSREQILLFNLDKKYHFSTKAYLVQYIFWYLFHILVHLVYLERKRNEIDSIIIWPWLWVLNYYRKLILELYFPEYVIM